MSFKYYDLLLGVLCMYFLLREWNVLRSIDLFLISSGKFSAAPSQDFIDISCILLI